MSDLQQPLAYQSLLERIMQLTQEMLQRAAEAEWEQVAQFDDERRDLLQKLFAEEIAPQAESMVRAAITEILAVDEKTMALAKAGQESVQQALLQLGKAARADKLYREES